MSIYPYILASNTNTHPTPCREGVAWGGVVGVFAARIYGYMEIPLYISISTYLEAPGGHCVTALLWETANKV